MALKLKDLQHRVYSGKQCVRFEVPIEIGDKRCVLAQFNKMAQDGAIDGNGWHMRLILGRTRDKDSEVYNFDYILPKAAVPLELVAATGLRYLQLYLKEEVQNKMALDFSLGEMLEGM